MAKWGRAQYWAVALMGAFANPALAADINAAAPPDAPVVMALQVDERPQKSRVVLEISDPAEFRVFLLTSPDRAVIEMPGALWRASQSPASAGKGLVKAWRFGLFRKDIARLVLDLNHPAKIDNAEIIGPKDGAAFRLVLDLSPTTSAEFAARAGWPNSVQLSRVNVAARPTQAGEALPVIVLDPGHGGMDPGTHSESGLVEKDIALSVARALKERLEGSGRYRVKLTRDRDVFIPLRERVGIARAAHADLFVSLHADSNEHREIRGASVYTLSPGPSDREAASLAEKENLSGAAFGQEVAVVSPVADAILMDIEQREIMNLSTRFAQQVVTALPPAIPVHQPLPHRSANFAVLKAPDIPSVLVELGYLTSPEDERAIATAGWRTNVAAAIAAAIDTHFAQSPALRLPAAEAKPLPSSGHNADVRSPTMLSSRAQEHRQ